MKSTGVFVDVGCYHPIKYSNTWALYKQGWRGINIDIDDIKIELFNMVRKDDVNIACAVSNRSGKVTYYRAGLFSQINTIAPEAGVELDSLKESEVECRTLTSIIDETIYRDKGIDLLSIDAEGHDYEVLTSLDFERYQPSVIAVETHEPVFDRVEKSELYKFVREKKYALVGWCGESLLMASAEFQAKLVEWRS